MAFAEEPLAKMRPDKTGTAGNKYSHRDLNRRVAETQRDELSRRIVRATG
jgi:hypothetical protein